MRCGSTACAAEEYGDVVDFKGLTLRVDGLTRTACSNCQLDWETPAQEAHNLEILRQSFADRRDEVRAADGLLRSDEISAVLEHLRITKSEAAAVFGGGPHAFHKYMTGEVLQSVAMDRLLRLAAWYGPASVKFLRGALHSPLRFSLATSLTEEGRVTLRVPAGSITRAATVGNAQPLEASS
jgi:hypothetical protein